MAKKQYTFVHKTWLLSMKLLLLALTVHCIVRGFLRPKNLLPNHSSPEKVADLNKNDRKVVLFLVDALREDFVQFSEDSAHLQTIDDDSVESYSGKKLQVFKDIKEQQPLNTLILPMVSQSPTITVVEAKGVLNGGV